MKVFVKIITGAGLLLACLGSQLWVNAMADRGHLDIVSDMTYPSFNVTAHYQHKTETVKVNFGTDRLPWDSKGKGRLEYVVVTPTDFYSSDLTRYASLYIRVRTTKNGAFDAGSLSEITPWNTASIMKYTIKYKTHNKAKGGHKTISLWITDSRSNNPYGNYHKTCPDTDTENYYTNTFTIKCNPLKDKKWEKKNSEKEKPIYQVHMIGMKVYEQGKRNGTIPRRVRFENTLIESRADKGSLRLKAVVRPEGFGKNLPNGSYKDPKKADSCSMAYYNAKHHLLYASCPVSQKMLQFDYHKGDNHNKHWYPKEITYIISELDLTNKHYKNIVNDHGVLRLVK